MLRNKKFIFIDRDGVINKDPGGWTRYNYVTKWEEFIFLPCSIDAIKKLNKAGYSIVVISNQGGISKGYFSAEQLDYINRRMIAEMKKNGAKLKKVYYCIHHDADNCDCRKPKTGLFRQAEKELGIETKGKFLIGDGRTDIEAGKKMGMSTILVLSGKSSVEEAKKWNTKPDYIFSDLLQAVEFILKGDKEVNRG